MANGVYLYITGSIFMGVMEYIPKGSEGLALRPRRVFIGKGNSVPAGQEPYLRKGGRAF